jgi:hypothetical protein
MDGMDASLWYLQDDAYREDEAGLRLVLVETVLVLCATRRGREVLRARKVYPVMRNLHAGESCVRVREAVETVVDMLMRGEEEEGKQERGKGVVEVVVDSDEEVEEEEEGCEISDLI